MAPKPLSFAHKTPHAVQTYSAAFDPKRSAAERRNSQARFNSLAEKVPTNLEQSVPSRGEGDAARSSDSRKHRKVAPTPLPSNVVCAFLTAPENRLP